jgi:hypothetical protein
VHIWNEHLDAKINAYHVLYCNYTGVIFGIQALYHNSCMLPDVPHMLHVPPSSYIYLPLSLSLSLSLFPSLSLSLSHFNSLNSNYKCRVPALTAIHFIKTHHRSLKSITFFHRYIIILYFSNSHTKKKKRKKRIICST